ncbi:MAG: sugar transferase [Patescibacteria group bacterium]
MKDYTIFFKQKRLGKDKKPFFIYKFRTMVKDAENLKYKIQNLNEADGPVFKINDDPRYTKIGRFLAHSGLDEIPQLINVIKGEMAFVGPRPLPVEEANKVPKKYNKRFSVLPGITSLWVVRGAGHSSFKKWMEDDLEYIKNKSFLYDVKIIIQTIWMLLKQSI